MERSHGLPHVVLKTCFPPRVLVVAICQPLRGSLISTISPPVGVVLGCHAPGHHGVQELALDIHQSLTVATLLSSKMLDGLDATGKPLDDDLVHTSKFDKAPFRRNMKKWLSPEVFYRPFPTKCQHTHFPASFHRNCPLNVHHLPPCPHMSSLCSSSSTTSSIFPPFSHILPTFSHLFPIFSTIFPSSFQPQSLPPQGPLNRPRLGWPPPSGRRDPGASAVDQRPRSRCHPRRHRPGRLGGGCSEWLEWLDDVRCI